MDILSIELKELFKKANNVFLKKDKKLFIDEVSERTLCGALKGHLDRKLYKTKFSKYHVDIEYNRNKNGRVKTCCPSIEGGMPVPVTINCDLIVHSRGEIIKQDNLIAIEMKKSSRSREEKDNDRLRLIALTKDSYDGVWSFDGKTLPDHVCRYKLGVYYEICFSKRKIFIEYYYRGECVDKEKITY